MAKMPEDRRDTFTDIYRLYEKYWDMPDTSEAFTKLAHELDPLYQKHGKSPLINRLLTAVYDAIDDERRIAREALKDGVRQV